MGKIKSIFATIDAIIGVVAFLSVSTIFVVNAASLQISLYGSVGSEIQLLGVEARAQHSIYLIDKLRLNMSGAEQLLDYDVGAGNYSLVQFNQSGAQYGEEVSFYRVIPIDGQAYYLLVNLNGTK